VSFKSSVSLEFGLYHWNLSALLAWTEGKIFKKWWNFRWFVWKIVIEIRILCEIYTSVFLLVLSLFFFVVSIVRFLLFLYNVDFLFETFILEKSWTLLCMVHNRHKDIFLSWNINLHFWSDKTIIKNFVCWIINLIFYKVLFLVLIEFTTFQDDIMIKSLVKQFIFLRCN